jgi:hypothetical protein
MDVRNDLDCTTEQQVREEPPTTPLTLIPSERERAFDLTNRTLMSLGHQFADSEQAIRLTQAAAADPSAVRPFLHATEAIRAC